MPSQPRAQTPDTTAATKTSQAHLVRRSVRTRLQQSLNHLCDQFLRSILLAFLGVVLGGGVGYAIARPEYRSVAAIEINPRAPQNSTQTPRRHLNNKIETHIDQQVQTLRNQDLIAKAAASNEWISTGGRQNHQSITHLCEKMEISRPIPGGHHIQISFQDTNPKVAQAAVNSLITAYLNLPNIKEPTSLDQQQELNELQAELLSLNSQITAITKTAGPVSLNEQHVAKLNEVRTIGSQLTKIKIAFANMQEPEVKGPTPQNFPQASRLATVDPLIVQWVARKQEIEHKLTILRRRMGRNAPPIQSHLNDIEFLNEQIKTRLGKTPDITHGTLSLGELRQRHLKMSLIYQQANTELSLLAQNIKDAEALKGATTEIKSRIKVIEKRLNHWDRTIRSQIVVHHGNLPSEPYLDPRPIGTMIGSLSGLSLGMLSAWMIGLLNPRVLRPQSAYLEPEAEPLLGTVPIIEGNKIKHTDSQLTALSIHEIRAHIQIRAEAKNQKAFAITSSSNSAGKTSLTVALGSALALSGTKTLVVDCDLAGRVLLNGTSQGPDTSQTPPRQSMDEAMIEMGYLDQTHTDILLFTDEVRLGLIAMLKGAALTDCVVDTVVDGLSILPALAGEPRHISKMSGKFVRSLIDQARELYDIILFDTGVIPGSVEALLVTSEVDGVILVANRGQPRNQFNRTISHLKRVGAQITGTIFNRTAAADLCVHPAKQHPRPQLPTPRNQKHTPRQPTRLLLQHAGAGLLAAAIHQQADSYLPARPQQMMPIADTSPNQPLQAQDHAIAPNFPRSEDNKLPDSLVGQAATEHLDPHHHHHPPVPGTPRTIANDDELDQALDDLLQEATMMQQIKEMPIETRRNL